MNQDASRTVCLRDDEIQSLLMAAASDRPPVGQSQPDWDDMEIHLQSCASCRDRVEQHLSIDALPSSSAATPSPGGLSSDGARESTVNFVHDPSGKESTTQIIRTPELPV